MKKPKGARPYSRAEMRRRAKELRRRHLGEDSSLLSRSALREANPLNQFHEPARQQLEAEAKARKPPPRKRLPVVQQLQDGPDALGG